MDIQIDELVIEGDRPAHIAKHTIKLAEVLEIIDGNYVYIQGKLDRWLLTGKSKKKRFLTIVVGKRRKKNTYGLITARPSSKEERSFYKEFTTQIGGEENGKNKTS